MPWRRETEGAHQGRPDGCPAAETSSPRQTYSGGMSENGRSGGGGVVIEIAGALLNALWVAHNLEQDR